MNQLWETIRHYIIVAFLIFLVVAFFASALFAEGDSLGSSTGPGAEYGAEFDDD